MIRRWRLLFGVVSLSAAVGCGGSKSSSPPPTLTPTPALSPAGALATVTPATHPGMPQIVNQGGDVVVNPILVPAVYGNDTNSAAEEAFMSALVASDWWTAVTAGYGVESATVAPAQSLGPTAPATITDEQIQTNVLALTPPASGVPIYVTFYPAGTTVTADGLTSCENAEAYHSIVLGADQRAYAVVPNCFAALGGAQGPFPTQMDEIGFAASHEIIEASTDPSPGGAWDNAGSPYGIWDEVSDGGEVGDYCEYTPEFIDPNETSIGSYVQRIWSNTAAAAGQNPCVPDAQPYFNAAPEMPVDNLGIAVGGNSENTQGITIGVGQSKVITLDLYANTNQPFSVFAEDFALLDALNSGQCHQGQACAAQELEFSFAPLTLGGAGATAGTGYNGTKMQVIIKVLKPGAVLTGGSGFYIVTEQGTGADAILYVWPAYVADG